MNSNTVSPETKIFNFFFPEVLSLLCPSKVLALVPVQKVGVDSPCRNGILGVTER